MSRSTLLLFALTVAAAPFAQAQSDASPKPEPVVFSSNQGSIQLTPAIAGSDLSLTLEFAAPVKSYLNADESNLSVQLELDTDNDAKTGWTQIDDLRRGSDYSVMIVLRLPGAGKTQEAFVSKWTVDPKYGPSGKIVDAKPRLSVDGNQLRLLTPLSALGLRKGQQVRIIPVAPGLDVTVEQTVKLQ